MLESEHRKQVLVISFGQFHEILNSGWGLVIQYTAFFDKFVGKCKRILDEFPLNSIFISGFLVAS